MDNKICKWCEEDKPISEFSLRKKNGKINTRAECKKCSSERRRELYHTRNKEKILARNKKYIEARREYKKEYDKKREINNKAIRGKQRKLYYLHNKEEIKNNRKEYYYSNKDKVISLNNDYVRRNKEKVRLRQRENHKKRKQEDIGYSILKVLRTRVGSAVKRKGKKCNKTMYLVGCDMPFLLKYIEEKFSDGMTWNNYGKKGWHVDHIIPCAKFDMTNIEDQKKCFHYTNLQPLWWIDNLKKGAKIL